MADYPILTEEGKRKLEEELQDLKGPRRQEVKHRIEMAKEHGDLSENAEYQDAREEQSFNEGRIIEIETILKSATIASSANKSGIRVGSKVVAAIGPKEISYTVVGSHESEPQAGLISCDSPLGQAFLGHKVGDKVEVETPRGKIIYTIKAIE